MWRVLEEVVNEAASELVWQALFAILSLVAYVIHHVASLTR
jgi:hypothetical protein